MSPIYFHLPGSSNTIIPPVDIIQPLLLPFPFQLSEFIKSPMWSVGRFRYCSRCCVALVHLLRFCGTLGEPTAIRH